MPLVKMIQFQSEIVKEYSITPAVESLGLANNTMSFYLYDGEKEGAILWEIEYLDDDYDEVSIGLWFKDKKLTDYDGVFSLPHQAIELLESAGYNVDYAK